MRPDRYPRWGDGGFDLARIGQAVAFVNLLTQTGQVELGPIASLARNDQIFNPGRSALVGSQLAHGNRADQAVLPDAAGQSLQLADIVPQRLISCPGLSQADPLLDCLKRSQTALVDSLSQGGVTVESYQYLGLGTVVERSHAQGTLTLTYIGTPGDAGDQYAGLDRFNRVVNQKWTAAGVTVDEYGYTYDRNSNVTSKENWTAWHAPLVHSDFYEAFSYDGLNRLTTTDRYLGSTNDQSWTLDALGNMGSVTTGGVTQSRTLNSQNELTGVGTLTLTYDSNGNMTTDDAGRTLVYDAWNRLVRAQSGQTTLVSFAYDGTGHRTQETASGTTTDLYYTTSWQIAEERVSVSYGNAGTVQSQNVWSPVYVNALVLRDRDTDANGSLDERLYFASDANFDVTSVISTAGAVLEHVVYTSYGTANFTDAAWNAGSDSKALRTLWQGGHWNAWINSYDFQRRFYSPSLMRWTTAEPSGAHPYVDGMNLYPMEGNGPISRHDPSGLTWIGIGPIIETMMLEVLSRIPDGWYGGISNVDANSLEQYGHGISNLLHYGFNTGSTPWREDEGEYSQESFYARSIRTSKNFQSERSNRLIQFNSGVLSWSKTQGDKHAFGFLRPTLKNIQIDTGDGGASGWIYWIGTQLTLGRVNISLDISGSPTQYVLNGKIKIFTPVTIIYECVDPFHLHIDDLIPIHEPGRFSSYIAWQENLYLVSSRPCGGRP